MSLRPREDFPGRMVRAQSRMAPGGRRWSESPIPRVARRRVRAMVGDEPPPPTDPYLRPVTISGGALVGGAGNNTLRDQTDTTYAQLSRTPHTGTLIATFETRDLGFEPNEARLRMRVRTNIPVPNFFYLVWTLAGSIPPGGVPASGKCCGFGTTDFTHPDFGGGLPLLSQTGDDWHTMSASWSDGYPEEGMSTPTAAQVSAGLQVYLDAVTSVAEPDDAGAAFQIDIADVWLELIP